MQRIHSVVKTKTQYFMTLPLKWIQCRDAKPRDKLMIFSSNEFSSPLVICTMREYMRNPEIKKLVDKLIKILEKSEGVI